MSIEQYSQNEEKRVILVGLVFIVVESEIKNIFTPFIIAEKMKLKEIYYMFSRANNGIRLRKPKWVRPQNSIPNIMV